MKDLMKPTVITAHSVGAESKTILITNDDPEYREWDISEAILAATSSPYFFPATTVGDENSQNRIYDGGVSAMNPTEILVQKALDQGYALEDIHVLSLGTGEFAPTFEISDSDACKALYWPAESQRAVGIDMLPYQ